MLILLGVMLMHVPICAGPLRREYGKHFQSGYILRGIYLGAIDTVTGGEPASCLGRDVVHFYLNLATRSLIDFIGPAIASGYFG